LELRRKGDGAKVGPARRPQRRQLKTMMKRCHYSALTPLQIMMVATASFLTGCGKSSSPYAPVAKLYQPSPDTDVTSFLRYNFVSFSGTDWRTKVQTAVADVKRYTGAHGVELLIPQHFDSTRPDYTRGADTQITAVLPAGARVRIERLMKDNGAWGGLMVTATVEDGTNSWKDVLLDELLLANNAFIPRDGTTSTNWGVNPEFLGTP
jgi:hypothetical protein